MVTFDKTFVELAEIKAYVFIYLVSILANILILTPFCVLIGYGIARNKGLPVKDTLKKALICGVCFGFAKGVAFIQKEEARSETSSRITSSSVKSVKGLSWNKYDLNEIILELPIELKKEAINKAEMSKTVRNFIKTFDTYTGEAGDLSIKVERTEFKNGVSIDLDNAASISARQLASDGDTGVKQSIEVIKLDDYDARSIIVQRNKLMVRSVMVGIQRVVWQVYIAYFEDKEASVQAQRILSSLTVKPKNN